ncbi:MAG TPA: SIS domain-containing protein [Sedimentisphaerales bacterium]|nr:SIS domain-containing protein [Sedimentisphaerales bacterium]
MDETIKNIINTTIETHKQMVDNLQNDNAQTIVDCAQLIIKSLRKGGTVYLCGNGGSAADAQHIAGEFVGRFKRERKALPAIALSTDTSVLTCIANDYDYESIFSRQVEALVKENDIFWGISTSGSSPNVIKAAKLAKENGAYIIAFTGKADSKLEKIADVCLCAQSKATASSQEIHQLAYHIICDLVEMDFVNP